MRYLVGQLRELGSNQPYSSLTEKRYHPDNYLGIINARAIRVCNREGHSLCGGRDRRSLGHPIT